MSDPVRELFPDLTDGQGRGAGALIRTGEDADADARLPPSFDDLDRLARLFEREAEALAAGDFDRFSRLQAEKRVLARAVERHAARGHADPLTEGAKAAALEALGRFEDAVRRNETALGAVTEASRRLKAYAIAAIERETGDGLYARGGSRALSGPVSTAGVRVKI